MMVLVIPGEEATAEGARLNDGLEAFWELWLVFQGLEVGLRERVIVRCVWPAVRLDHAEIGAEVRALVKGLRARHDAIVVDAGG